MTCLGVLEKGERRDANETSLKEGGVIEMSTTVLSITRCSLSSLEILTIFCKSMYDKITNLNGFFRWIDQS
jgi:hypothetical protein